MKIMRDPDNHKMIGNIVALQDYRGKFKIFAKESSESPPLGVIIDVYASNIDKNAEPLESYTLWYDDYLEEGGG